MKTGVILLVINAYLISRDVSDAIRFNQTSLYREKRYNDDRWIWDVTTHAPIFNKPKPYVSEQLQDENPCLRPPLQKPDFKASGKRVSIQKCDEYKWNREARNHTQKMENDCKAYNRDHGVFEISVIGGLTTLPREYVHMGAIGWKATVGNWIFKCGCTLISPKFALTAAHCTKTSHLDDTVADPLPKIIRFSDGSIGDDSSETLDRKIAQIITHPQYRAPKKYDDIALLEIDNLFAGFEIEGFNNNLHAACLWPDQDLSALGTKATVTGWGVFDAGPGIASTQTSSKLQAATVDIIDSQKCDELLKPKRGRHWNGLQDSQICAGVLKGGVDTCQGDSGGPLQVKIFSSASEGGLYYVIGVTSFGFKCAQENTPAVYTRVSKYLDWIEGLVWPGEK